VRKGSIEIVLFLILYKLDTVFATALMTPFFMSLDFSKSEIGAVIKGFGLIATLVGTFAGGGLLINISLKSALFFFGLLQGFSGLAFYFLALAGHSYLWMIIAITVESFFSGMGNAAYAVLVMSLCHPKFTATQFALLTSLMTLSRTLAGAPCGWIQEKFGWPSYFLISIVLMVPGLLLLFRFSHWQLQTKGKKV
jgi:PAT family beta-lactamase induction signal transducer AmpG